MTCAACQARIEKAVGAVKGVEGVSVQLLQNAMAVRFDDSCCSSEAICQAVAHAGYEAHAVNSVAEALQEDDKAVAFKHHKLMGSVVLTVVLMIVSMGSMVGIDILPDAQSNAYVQLALCLMVVALNTHYFTSGFKALLGLNPNMDSLVALGASASLLFSIFSLVLIPEGSLSAEHLHHQYPVYFESVATILTLVGVGKFLEAKAKHKAVNAISALYDLAPESVCKRICKADGSFDELHVPLSTIAIGDEIILRPGDNVGVDGIVIEGSGSCDESALTGEARPVSKKVGSNINSATFLKSGYVVFKVKRIGADTTLAQIIALVDEANNQKAPISRIADRIAFFFVPTVIAIALLTAVMWLVLGANPSHALTFAVSVLVVSCPCALGLAAPTAIMVATGRAASLGVLFKTPEALERLSKVDILVFDKTGTITAGKMSVAKFDFIENDAVTKEQCLKLVLALEQRSEHPIGKALVAYCKEQLNEQHIDSFMISSFINHEGLGVQMTIKDHVFYIGSTDFMDSVLKGKVLNSVDKRPCNEAEYEPEKRTLEQQRLDQYLLVHLFDAKQQYASFYLADRIKQSARKTVKMLNLQSIRPLLMSGDRIPVVHAVAKSVGIDTYKASCMPSDKAYLIDKLKNRGHIVAMMGDGINDAPSLATSDVAISVVGSSNIATSCADVILMRDELRLLPYTIELSRLTIKNIQENFFWACVYNVICIPLAAGAFLYPFGWQLNPMLAALLMSMSSLCVVTNALRLRTMPLNSLVRVSATHCKAMACQECENYASCGSQHGKSAKPDQVNPVPLDLDLPARVISIARAHEQQHTTVMADPLATGKNESCYCLDANTDDAKVYCSLKDKCFCSKKGQPSNLDIFLDSDLVTQEITNMEKTIGIEGMSCPHCVKSVTKALNAIEGCEVLEVSLEHKCAKIKLSALVEDATLQKAIVDNGFECTFIK